MTSMPASRSALATTLAPRSCPSSPGLATTTRMRPCATVFRSPFAACADPGSAAGPHLGRYYPATPDAPASHRRTTAAVPDPDQQPLSPGRDPGGRVAYL